MSRKRTSAPGISLYKSIFEVRYEAKLEFYDLLFSAAQKMDEYPHWVTDRLSITLKDYDKRCSLAIRHKNIGYGQDSGDVDMEGANIKKAMEVLPKQLDISSFTRIGFRRKYLFTTSMKFEELRQVLDLKLLSQNNELRGILPTQVDDFRCVFDLSDDRSKFHLTIGPIRKDEMPRWIDFDKENHLDPQKVEEDYMAILRGYPTVAVFIDIDIYREKKGISVQETSRFYPEARKRLENIVDGFLKYLF